MYTSRPLLPFAALGASAILVILLMGASKQFTTNFQRPYSVDARSKPTIEIFNAPVVLNIQSKPELQNRIGGNKRSIDSNDVQTEGTEEVENNLAHDTMQWNLPKDAKARLGKGYIGDIQYSPDGKFLAVAGGIGIWLYDTTTHQEGNLLTDHINEVESIAFSRDGYMMAGGSVNGPITLWDRRTGALTTLTGHTDIVWSVVFSLDGKTVASDSRDGTTRLWDVITGDLKLTLTKDTKSASKLSFTPDVGTIVSVSWEEKISLWDSITGQEKKHSLCIRIVPSQAQRSARMVKRSLLAVTMAPSTSTT